MYACCHLREFALNHRLYVKDGHSNCVFTHLFVDYVCEALNLEFGSHHFNLTELEDMLHACMVVTRQSQCSPCLNRPCFIIYFTLNGTILYKMNIMLNKGHLKLANEIKNLLEKYLLRQ